MALARPPSRANSLPLGAERGRWLRPVEASTRNRAWAKLTVVRIPPLPMLMGSNNRLNTITEGLRELRVHSSGASRVARAQDASGSRVSSTTCRTIWREPRVAEKSSPEKKPRLLEGATSRRRAQRPGFRLSSLIRRDQDTTTLSPFSNRGDIGARSRIYLRLPLSRAGLSNMRGWRKDT